MDRGSQYYTGDGNQTPRKRNARWQSSCLRRNSRGKKRNERQRYTQLNAEFQRIARRDKKAFLNEQCKKEKCLSEEALKIIEKGRVVKGKGERIDIPI